MARAKVLVEAAARALHITARIEGSPLWRAAAHSFAAEALYAARRFPGAVAITRTALSTPNTANPSLITIRLKQLTLEAADHRGSGGEACGVEGDRAFAHEAEEETGRLRG